MQSDSLDAVEELDGVRRFDEAHLEVRAGGHLHVAARERVRDVGELAELVGRELAARDAQA